MLLQLPDLQSPATLCVQDALQRAQLLRRNAHVGICSTHARSHLLHVWGLQQPARLASDLYGAVRMTSDLYMRGLLAALLP